MKNLKRVLSLALSGIMLVGMMAMSASAVNAEDFTDSDEITHTEAVSISTALKIIDGKEDGSFDPNGNVTRGQMAKMITRAMFGGEDPILGTKATPTFTDIKGRWDESYIEYCANEGIISGRGDGTFDPEGNVTGTEAAKMLLVALGYKADIYYLTGPDWAITTNSIANRTDVALYSALKGLDPTQPFTRDQVAQMIYNALNAETREMNPNMSITNGEVTYEYRGSGKTLLYDKYGAIRVEGVVTANEFTDNAETQKGKTSLSITNQEEITEMLGSAATNPNFAVPSGKDVFGRAVILYVKPSNNTPKNMSRATVISDVILDVDSNVEYTTTGDTSKGISKWADDKGLKFGDRDEDTAGVQEAAFFTNYAPAADADGDNDFDVAGEFGNVDAKGVPSYKNVQGIELTIIDNNADGIVDVVLQNISVFGQVTKYTEKGDNNVTVKVTNFDSGIVGSGKAIAALRASDLTPSNEKLANVVAYDDIKADDYVNCTKVSDTYYVTLAETVNGDLESFENDPEDKNSDKAKSATVDGETYKVSKVSEAYGDLKSMNLITKRSVLTNEVTLYLDAFGYACAGSTKAASDWLFVANAAVNNSGTSLRGGSMTAYVYLQDGTSGSYVVDKYTPAGSTTAVESFTRNTDDQAIIGKLFKYSIASNGHLVLEGAAQNKTNSTIATAFSDDAKGTQNEVTVATWTAIPADKNSGDENKVEYDRELSKLTLTNTVAATGDTTETTKVKYVTMDTPVFYVSLKTSGGKQIIDKVNVYDQKSAPSMKYNVENNSNALHKGTGDEFVTGVTYVSNADSQYNLDAVLFTSTSTVGSDWLFVINYVKSVDGGRFYNAIVDGELTQIDTTDVVGSSRNENTAYGYSMDGDRYALDPKDSPYSPSLVRVGQVTLIDRKSIIVEDGATGTEAKITNNTITAYIDGEDTELDVNVQKGDVVYLIKDESNNAVAIFILAEYDDTAKDVVWTDVKVGAGVTYEKTTASNTFSTDYTVSVAAMGAKNTVADLQKLFAVSGDATAKLVKEATGTADTTTDNTITKPTGAFNAAANNAESDATTLSAGDVYYLLITSKDAGASTTTYTVKTIGIEA